MFRLFTLLIVAVAFIYAIEGLSSFKPAGRDIYGRVCKPVHCEGKIKHCQYGYRKQEGCEICKCHDPCNPTGKALLCGHNQKCSVHETSSGNFVGRCGPLRRQRSNVACEHKKVVGKCRASFKRFYYNSLTNKCEQFSYSGCGGNDNNFETHRQCQTTCVY